MPAAQNDGPSHGAVILGLAPLYTNVQPLLGQQRLHGVSLAEQCHAMAQLAGLPTMPPAPASLGAVLKDRSSRAEK